MAVLTGQRINEGFLLQETGYGLLARRPKKSGRNNDRGDRITEVVLRRGFTEQQTQHGVASGIQTQANSCKEVSALTLSQLCHPARVLSLLMLILFSAVIREVIFWILPIGMHEHFRPCEIYQLFRGQNHLHLHFIIR